MNQIRKLVEGVLSGTLIQPTVTTSAAELSGPICHAPSLRARDEPRRSGRRNFSQLLGITAVTPEESQKKGDESQAPSPAVGPDQPEGNK